MDVSKIQLIVHGGAWNIPDSIWNDNKQGCETAYRLAHRILENGGTALHAVAAAVRLLEDDPTFDAGFGAFLNSDGQVELDAGIMDGDSLRIGAVLGVNQIKNPIDLALHILENSEHCLFTSEGAHRLAKEAGFPRVDHNVHIHPRQQMVYERLKENQIAKTAQDKWRQGQQHDTVGAIARDVHGNLAAGNSTSGILHKAVGRVGDSALPGVGFYADNELGAVVCSGWGERIMSSAVLMRVLHHLKESTVQEAADFGIRFLEERVGGYGGIVVMAPSGEIGLAHNTERMAYWGNL